MIEDGYFVSHAWYAEFVRKPFGITQHWFLNPTVISIDETVCTCHVFMTVRYLIEPFNLFKKQRLVKNIVNLMTLK